MNTSNTRRMRLAALGLGLALLALTATARAADVIDEPATNQSSEAAMPLGDSPVRAKSRAIWEHYFKLSVPQHGIYKLTLTRPLFKTETSPSLSVRITGKDRARYFYGLPAAPSDALATHTFYPVLDGGDYTLELLIPSEKVPKISVELAIAPFKPMFGEAEHKATEAALDRAMKKMEGRKTPTNDMNVMIPFEAMVMAALSEGKDAKSRAQVIDSGYLPFLQSNFKEYGSKYNGVKLSSLSSQVYEVAITALSLSEVVANGHEKARPLARHLMRYLLAAQLTGSRPPEVGKSIAPNNVYFGGWRYAADFENGDISAAGWCAVALMASETVAETPAEKADLRRALDSAMVFVKHCTYARHFTYMPGGNDDISNIRSAIGALLLTLYADDSQLLDLACQDLDYHLPNAVHVDEEGDYPFYYWYYATRLNYLRGGYAWEAWRTTMAAQLISIQREDGTFHTYTTEASLAEPYSTALGSMILRMCLNDVPAYLKQEVRGF